MRFFLFTAALLAAAVPSLSADPPAPPRAAAVLAPPVKAAAKVAPFAPHEDRDAGPVTQARKGGCGCEEGGDCKCFVCGCDPSYKGAYGLSLHSGRPLVVFIGQPARPVAGCVTHADRGTFPEGLPRVAVGLPNANRDGIDCLEVTGQPGDAQVLAGLERLRKQLAPPVPLGTPVYYQPAIPSFYGMRGCSSGGCR